MSYVNISDIHQKSYLSDEAFNTLRANLDFCGKDIQAVVLTSSVSGEGKSYISLGLAKSLAETGKRVLYLDADMRRSTLNGKIHVDSKSNGLSNLLAGQCKVNDVLIQTDISSLYIVPAGPFPPNPAMLLSGSYFSSVLDSFRQVFDYIIIDTPPLGSVIDAALIAAECDGVAVVVAEKMVTRAFLKSVINQLKKVNCNILGLVQNKVDFAQNSYYKRYYGKGYYNSSNRGKEV